MIRNSRSPPRHSGLLWISRSLSIGEDFFATHILHSGVQGMSTRTFPFPDPLVVNGGLSDRSQLPPKVHGKCDYGDLTPCAQQADLRGSLQGARRDANFAAVERKQDARTDRDYVAARRHASNLRAGFLTWADASDGLPQTRENTGVFKPASNGMQASDATSRFACLISKADEAGFSGLDTVAPLPKSGHNRTVRHTTCSSWPRRAAQSKGQPIVRHIWYPLSSLVHDNAQTLV